MRYVVIIADGSALAGPGEDLYAVLDAAETPCLDAMGRFGKVGVSATAGSPGFARGALGLLGYPPECTTRLSDAVAEAAGRAADNGITLRPGDAVLRVGLVRVSDEDTEGLLLGAEAGGADDESRALFDDLIAHWRSDEAVRTRMAGVEFVGTGAARLMIVRAPGDDALPGVFDGVEVIDPATVEGGKWVEHLPDGGHGNGAAFLCELISLSRHFLADHPVNAARAEQGLGPINLAWFWDHGTTPDLSGAGLMGQGVQAAFFVDGAGAQLSRAHGLASLLGAEAVEASGDELVGGAIGCGAEVAVVLTGRPIAEIDAVLAGPVISELAGEPAESVEHADDAAWRVLVAVSHDPAGAASMGGGLSPFVLAGGRVRSVVDRRLSGALGSDLRVEPASDLLEYVLRSGLRGVV